MDLDKLFWLLLGIATLAFVVMIFASCYEEQHPGTTIDGCKYVRDYNSLAHKGNCRQCEERLRKIIKEDGAHTDLK